MRKIECPRTSQCLHLPAIGQPLPAIAELDVSELQAPQERRTIGEF